MSKFIPNAYQTPNFYLDNYMGKLTSDQWVVLSYAIRRILGFNKESDNISLSQFTDGIENKDFGTGLSVNTCRKALAKLVDFGLMVKLEEYDRKTNSAVLWGLQLDSDKVNDDLINKEWKKRKNKSSTKADEIKEPVSHGDTGLYHMVIEQYTEDKQINYVSDASQSPDDFLNQQSLIELPEPKKKIRKPNITYQTVLELQRLEPTIQKGHCLKVVKELLQKYTSQQIIDCAKNLQSNQWWIDNNIKITPTQIKKHIPDFAKQENIDEHGNMIEILEDGTQLIKLQSEIKQDSNIIVVEY